MLRLAARSTPSRRDNEFHRIRNPCVDRFDKCRAIEPQLELSEDRERLASANRQQLDCQYGGRFQRDAETADQLRHQGDVVEPQLGDPARGSLPDRFDPWQLEPGEEIVDPSSVGLYYMSSHINMIRPRHEYLLKFEWINRIQEFDIKLEEEYRYV